MTEEHVEIESGLVIPNWFLKLLGAFGTLFVGWGVWVTVTLSQLTYKIDTISAHTSGGQVEVMRVHINDLLRRIEKLERDAP